MTPTIISQCNICDVDTVIIRHDKNAGLYYELGIELPMDFSEVKNLDANKICELIGITGIPISVDRCASNEYGCLEGKPALFVMAAGSNFDNVYEWAKECADKISNFDFADYCIVHDGYNGLTKDERPDWIKDQSYNIDSGEWETQREIASEKASSNTLKKGHVVILVGKSAAGKDAIQNELVKQYGFKPLVSTTSRPIRENEKEGVSYFFVSKDEFLKRVNEGKFLEYRDYQTNVNGEPATWYYGMEKQELDGECVTVLDLYGANEFIKYYGKENCSVIHVAAPDRVREARARARGSFDKTEWDRRLLDDAMRFAPNKTCPGEIVDYEIFNNGDLQDAVDKIIEAEIYRAEAMAKETAGASLVKEQNEIDDWEYEESERDT